jgi:iron complex transport system ATP-binding protein
VGEDDPDAETARDLGADLVTVPPFAPVDDAARAAVAERVRRADAVVVADVPVASGNCPNLAVVDAADTPVVVVDERSIEARNVAGERGRRLAERLEARGTAVEGDADAVVAAVHRTVDERVDDPGCRATEVDLRP